MNQDNIYKSDKAKVIMVTIILFFINIVFIGRLNMPFISGDEMGYISIAGFFTGKDWSSVMQNISYYSYGYSILIFPFILLIKNPVTLYKVLVLINGIIISLIFPTTYKLALKINKEDEKTNNNILIFISLLASTHASFIVRTNLVLPEALLILLFLFTLHQLIDYLESKKTFNVIILSIIISYMYVLHQRTIGIFIALLLTFIFMILNKKGKIKDTIVFIGIFTAVFFLNNVMKNYLKESLWLNSQLFEGNNFSGQVDKITVIFSIEGMSNFIKTLIGQVYYFIVSTYGFGLVGMIFLVYKVIKIIKSKDKKDEGNKIFFSIFLILSFLGVVAISVISMFISIDKRADILVYGRYIENIFPIYTLIGLLFAYKKIVYDDKIKPLLTIPICILVISIILAIVGDIESAFQFASMNSIFLSLFYYGDKIHFISSGLFTVAIFTIIIFFMWKKNMKAYIVTLVVTSGISIFIGSTVIKESIIKTGDINFKNNKPVSEILNDEDIENIYYLGYKLNSNAAYIQYLLYDKPLICFDSQKDFDLNKLEGNHYLVTEQISKEIISKYDFKRFVNGVFFLKSKEVEDDNNYFTIEAKQLVRRFTYEDMEDKEIKLVSGGHDYMLLDNQEITLEEGNYKFKVSLNLLAIQKKMENVTGKTIATIDIVSYDPEKHKYGSIDINIDDLNNGEVIAVFPLEVNEKSYNFNLEINIRKGYSMEVKTIVIE